MKQANINISVWLLLIVLVASPATGQTSTHLWSQRFGSEESDQGRCIAVDNTGNVVVAGTFRTTVDFGGGPLTSAGDIDIFVAKYDPDGNHLWSKRFGNSTRQYVYGITADNSGNVLITGGFKNSMDFGGELLIPAGSYDIFIAKYDSNGNHIWSQRFGGAEHEYGYSIVCDRDEDILVTGYTHSTVDFGGGPLTPAGKLDIFLAKFESDGSHMWSRCYGGPELDYGFDIALDRFGNVIVTGCFENTADFGGGTVTGAGERDIFIAKYDADGKYLWSNIFGGIDSDWALGVAVDGGCNAIITGVFGSAIDFGGGLRAHSGRDDIFVAKYDPEGNHIWSSGFGSGLWDRGMDIAVSHTGNILVTGEIRGTVDFGGEPLKASLIDIFVVEFSPNGDHIWSDRFGGIESDLGYDIAVDANGDAVVTGYIEYTVDFGGGPLTSAGQFDVFLAKFKGASSPAIIAALDIKPGSCSNPFNKKVFDKNPLENTGSMKGGVLPVALLGDIDFDVTLVDVATVELEGVGPLRHHFEDIAEPSRLREVCPCPIPEPDGYMDMEIKFKKSDVARALSSASHGERVQLTLTGKLLDGTSFIASDCVRIIGKTQGPQRDLSPGSNEVSLGAAVPNPFNPATRISYYIPSDDFVSLTIFDVTGKLIQELVVQQQPAGKHIVEWNADGMPSGVYFYRLKTGNKTLTKKMVLLK